MLDAGLEIKYRLPATREKIRRMLEGKPDKLLKADTVDGLRGLVGETSGLFDRIEAESVFCHGDLNYSNILISGEKLYLIDFEYVFSGSCYHDIGHFFRRKDDDVQRLINAAVREAFTEGYDASGFALPSDWLTLARLCDVSAMLCLLTMTTRRKNG